MPTWNNKPIDDLKDDELRNAFVRTKAMSDAYNKIRQSDEFKKRMKNRSIPDTNPSFIELFDALTEEVNKRKLAI